MDTVGPWGRSDIPAVYEELLKSNEGDILVKLKDGKQLKVVSYLVKNRSSVFKTMLDSSMQDTATGMVDLSSQYSLEAFCEFMAYIYYNKTYAGSYLPLLFEILSIADYYEVDAYRTYINDRIIALITDVPICLMIAFEALKHGTLTEKIYARCLSLLVEALKPQEGMVLVTVEPKRRVCYDIQSKDIMAWCCSDHSTKTRLNSRTYIPGVYAVDGKVACIDSTTRRSVGYSAVKTTGYSERCCIHRPSKPVLANIGELPDFIVDDVKSAIDLEECESE